METIKAVAVTPGVQRSATLREAPTPALRPGEVLVRVVDVAIDGTDAKIDDGLYGEAPPGEDHLIIGHESLGRVERAGADVTGLWRGELVVATVRRPGGCLNCRAGESDMCLDGDYAERGIRRHNRFMAEYYAESPVHPIRCRRPFGRSPSSWNP